jgi:hypothetical protein
MTAAVLIAWASALIATHAGTPTADGGTEVWGTVPAWVSAIGASLAFFLTFTLFLQGRRDRVREQAEMVYATEQAQPADDGSLSIKATVFNKSTAPIWDVEVHPRWSGEVDVDLEQLRPFVDPGRSRADWAWEIGQDEIQFRRRPPRVVFSDAAGRRWEKVGSNAVKINRVRRLLRSGRRRWDEWRES